MLTAKFHVCGDVTYGFKKEKRIPPSPRCPFSWLGAAFRSRVNTVKILGVMAILEWSGESGLARIERGIRLGLSKLTNSNSRSLSRSRRMQTPAKRRIKGAARVMEAKYEARYCSFITLTVPDAIAFQIDASHWQEAWHLFRIKMKRHLSAAGVPLDHLGVYEVHPARSEKNGIPMLHIHAVFVGRTRYTSWAVTPSQLTEMWKEVWESQFPELAPSLGWNASTNIESIRKSVASYLGKYLASNKFNPESFFSEPEYERFFPRNWTMVSRPLLQLVKQNTMQFFGNEAFNFLEKIRYLAVLHDWKVYRHFVTFPDGQIVEVGGFIGCRIKPEILCI